jgi:hypothetical protein
MNMASCWCEIAVRSSLAMVNLFGKTFFACLSFIGAYEPHLIIRCMERLCQRSCCVVDVMTMTMPLEALLVTVILNGKSLFFLHIHRWLVRINDFWHPKYAFHLITGCMQRIYRRPCLLWMRCRPCTLIGHFILYGKSLSLTYPSLIGAYQRHLTSWALSIWLQNAWRGIAQVCALLWTRCWPLKPVGHCHLER